MKKLLIFCLIVILLVSSCLFKERKKCSSNAECAEIPSGFISKQEYYDKSGFQDYTDYAKYIYSSKEAVINNEDYKIVNTEDFQKLKDYFNDFRGWMETCNRLDEFDFDENIINEGDYVRLNNNEYDNYTIYFFDIETLTLYYIHNNT